MRKGEVYPLERGMFEFGVGWSEFCEDDLDLSAIIFHDNEPKAPPLYESADRLSADTVFYNSQHGNGVWSGGDSQTGKGKGDNEVIYIDMNNTKTHAKAKPWKESTTAVYLVLSVFRSCCYNTFLTSGNFHISVRAPVLGDFGTLATFKPPPIPICANHLIIGAIYKNDTRPGGWDFLAVGETLSDHHGQVNVHHGNVNVGNVKSALEEHYKNYLAAPSPRVEVYEAPDPAPAVPAHAMEERSGDAVVANV